MLFNCGCWRRLSRVPWTARRSNQSVLKEISLEYSLEGLMLKLKLQYFDHSMQRTDSFKDRDSGKDCRWKKKGTTEDEMVGWHPQLCGHEFEQAPGVGDGQGSLVCCSSWGHKKLDRTEWLNWPESPPYLWFCFSVSVTLGPPWPKNITWKIPEINNL